MAVLLVAARCSTGDASILRLEESPASRLIRHHAFSVLNVVATLDAMRVVRLAISPWRFRPP